MATIGELSGQAKHSCCRPVLTVHITLDSLQYSSSMPWNYFAAGAHQQLACALQVYGQLQRQNRCLRRSLNPAMAKARPSGAEHTQSVTTRCRLLCKVRCCFPFALCKQLSLSPSLSPPPCSSNIPCCAGISSVWRVLRCSVILQEWWSGLIRRERR